MEDKKPKNRKGTTREATDDWNRKHSKDKREARLRSRDDGLVLRFRQTGILICQHGEEKFRFSDAKSSQDIIWVRK